MSRDYQGYTAYRRPEKRYTPYPPTAQSSRTKIPRGDREHFDKQQEACVVVANPSKWASPIVLVPKKNGTFLIWVKDRRLNTVLHTGYLHAGTYGSFY